MGGPSAAIVLEELCDLGLQAAVRIGTCGALDPRLSLGDLVAADEVLCADGASHALGAPERLAADRVLTAALAAHAEHTGLIASTDLFYDRDPARARAWRHAGVLAVEMEAAALLAVARHRGVRVACLLGVSDTVPEAGEGRRVDAASLADLGVRLGSVAVQALAHPVDPPVSPGPA
jgi:uridine phosphorylase